MKKYIALSLIFILLLGSTGIAIAATVDNATAPAAASEYSLYLVPGTYVSGGNKVANTISNGATKLNQEQCDEIFTDNAYLCTLAEGASLPTPTTTRVDKDGNPYTFNGWWSIVDATVTYFDKVPALTANTFLYADWRADLSQRMDPVEPSEQPEQTNIHYMLIKHSDGTETKVNLMHGSTDQLNAEHLGYNYAAQLYTTWLQLQPGDKFEVYTTGLKDSEEAVIAPFAPTRNDSREIQLESNGTGTNRTTDYLDADVPSYWTSPYTISYKLSEARYFNIYIKFYSGGTVMTVYMEPAVQS